MKKVDFGGIRAPSRAVRSISATLTGRISTAAVADPEVTAALSPAEIEEKFDLGYHTKHVDTIFARVFGA